MQNVLLLLTLSSLVTEYELIVFVVVFPSRYLLYHI